MNGNTHTALHSTSPHPCRPKTKPPGLSRESCQAGNRATHFVTITTVHVRSVRESGDGVGGGSERMAVGGWEVPGGWVGESTLGEGVGVGVGLVRLGGGGVFR